METPSIDLYHFARCRLIADNGESVEAGDLWRDSKVMFVFLRHFACIACRAHAKQIWEKREAYEKSNTRVVFVGNGLPIYAAEFRKDMELEGIALYTDPTLESFRHCGFKRGFLNLVSAKSVMNAGKLFLQGHRQSSLDTKGGDHWQLGGVVVINPDNTVGFHFISEALGDFPPSKDPT
jgi:peroxiredoxin